MVKLPVSKELISLDAIIRAKPYFGESGEFEALDVTLAGRTYAISYLGDDASALWGFLEKGATVLHSLPRVTAPSWSVGDTALLNHDLIWFDENNRRETVARAGDEVTITSIRVHPEGETVYALCWNKEDDRRIEIDASYFRRAGVVLKVGDWAVIAAAPAGVLANGLEPGYTVVIDAIDSDKNEACVHWGRTDCCEKYRQAFVSLTDLEVR